MLGANKRRRACYRHLRQRCHGGGGCVRPDERDPCSRRQLLFDHRHRQVTACLESQTSANFLRGNWISGGEKECNVMEPMKWALQALDIIESERAIWFPQGRLQRLSPKLTWKLRRLFSKSELLRLRKSKK